MISGHQSGRCSEKDPASAGCLNPFDIRASVRTALFQQHQAIEGLNPFDIRASVRTQYRAQLHRGEGVSIPLISGHQSGRSMAGEIEMSTGLNPFDIRASVRTAKSRMLFHDIQVSIPLISGHQSGLSAFSVSASSQVSIPLISGHQSGRGGFRGWTISARSQSL